MGIFRPQESVITCFTLLEVGIYFLNFMYAFLQIILSDWEQKAKYHIDHWLFSKRVCF